MIKAVVFDLDDTLISEREYIKSGFNTVCRKISSDYNLDYKTINKLINDLFNEDHKEVFNRLLDLLYIEYDLLYIKELVDLYRNHLPDITLYEDARYILNYLLNKGYKLGIITDGYAVAQRQKLKALDIENIFDCIIVTDELGREYWKPHEKSYRIMKEKLNVEFNEMMYVGDNINKDFVTANKLGIITIMINKYDNIYYNRTKDNYEYEAFYKMENLKELKKFIEGEF